MQYKKFIIHVYLNLQNLMEPGKGGGGKPLFDKHYLRFLSAGAKLLTQ